jgi:hypothetical protein
MELLNNSQNIISHRKGAKSAKVFYRKILVLFFASFASLR